MRKHLEDVEITAIDSRGRGRGSAIAGDGTIRPVYVMGAYPGDHVDVRVKRRKSGAYLGDVVAFREGRGNTVSRVQPFCRHFSECGGCTLQEIAYADQLRYKEAIVSAAFHELSDKIADTELPSFQAILPAPREQRFRNKLEYSFGAHRWLSDEEITRSETIADRRGFGFHAPGRFDRVVDVTECYLQPEPSETIRAFVREHALREGWSFYDSREHNGLLRLMTIRTSLSGETMVIVMFGEEDPEAIETVMSAIASRFPALHSLNYVVNTSKNDSLASHTVRNYRGAEWIIENSGSNRLRIRPKAFYQTNPEQAIRLYQRAIEMAGFTGGETVFDLYCGIGSIALFVAPRVKRVVGVEVVEDAVTAARENAALNEIDNVDFVAGEVESVLDETIDRWGVPDVVVLDPPRAGVHPAARKAIRGRPPRRIVYISCNPRSQATDIADLIDLYRVVAVQPVDMFPQTRHVENIAILERR